MGGASQREGPAEHLVELGVLVGMAGLGLAFAAPPLAVGAPVLGALHALRRRSSRAHAPLSLLCGAPALAAVAGASLHGAQPADLAVAYTNLQLDAGEGLLRAWKDAAPFDWGAYARGMAPYALPGGVALGSLADALVSALGARGEETEKESRWAFQDAADVAGYDGGGIDWLLPNVLGRGVVTLLSAPPGTGKAWWTWALVRAIQDNLDFYGMRPQRPFSHPGRLRRRLGARPRPLKILWCTEEGPSFGETRAKFGINRGLVTTLQRHTVRETDWPTIVRRLRHEAWLRGCAYVIIDTVRAWCPQAEKSNDQAAEVFNLARKELAGAGLGVFFVHHDRKGGGEYGEGVAGPNNLVGSTDVLVELKRVRGKPDARRMVVSRRFGDLDVTAELVEGHRYEVVVDEEKEEGDEKEAVDGEPGFAKKDGYLIPTFNALRLMEAGATPKALQLKTGTAAATLAKHLGKLEKKGLVVREGEGKRGAAQVWTVVAPGTTPKAANPTGNPEYLAHLKSAEWKRKAAEIRDRADGLCEECRAEPGEGDTLEVHHLTYERIFREDPDDLVVLCSPCHRKAHGR
jgi:hypothetical protein